VLGNAFRLEYRLSLGCQGPRFRLCHGLDGLGFVLCHRFRLELWLGLGWQRLRLRPGCWF
jgi:hypothetical protein